MKTGLRIGILTGVGLLGVAVVSGVVFLRGSSSQLSVTMAGSHGNQKASTNSTAQSSENAPPVTNTASMTTSPANNVIQGYLYSSSRDVMFIQYTASNSGQISGTFYADYVNSNNNFKTYNSPISGIVNGNNISITVTDSGQTYTGNLSRGVLNLAFPQNNGTVQNVEFQQGTLNDYNQVVSQVQSTVANDQAAQQQAQQTANLQNDLQSMESAVAGVYAQIPSDITNLDSVISGAKKDISQEQADLQQTYKDLQTVLNEPSGTGQAGSDAATVGSDAATVGSDDATMNSDQASLSATVQSANGDTLDLQSAFNKMTSDAQALGLSVPSSLPTSSDVSSMVQKEQNAVNSATSTMNDLLKQSQGMVKQANQYANQASTAAG